MPNWKGCSKDCERVFHCFCRLVFHSFLTACSHSLLQELIGMIDSIRQFLLFFSFDKYLYASHLTNRETDHVRDPKDGRARQSPLALAKIPPHLFFWQLQRSSGVRIL